MKAEDREPLAQALFDAGYGVGEQVDIDRLKAKLAALGWKVVPIDESPLNAYLDYIQDAHDKGHEQAAEAADREAAGAGESGTLRTPDARSSAAVAPLDAAWHLFREHLAAEAERLGYWHSEDYDGTGNPRRIPCIPVTIAEQIAEKHWPVFAAAYADAMRKRGGA